MGGMATPVTSDVAATYVRESGEASRSPRRPRQDASIGGGLGLLFRLSGGSADGLDGCLGGVWPSWRVCWDRTGLPQAAPRAVSA